MQILFTLELYDAGFRIRKELERLYPKCFFPVGLEKPLKIGIMEDLLAIRETLDITPIPTEEELYASILVYTGSLSYRASLIREGAFRVDLEGNDGDTITDNAKLTAKTRHLAPKWKLTDEELAIVRERYLEHKARLYAESMGYFEPNPQHESNQIITEAEEEPESDITNPNLARPKLTLKKAKS